MSALWEFLKSIWYIFLIIWGWLWILSELGNLIANGAWHVTILFGFITSLFLLAYEPKENPFAFIFLGIIVGGYGMICFITGIGRTINFVATESTNTYLAFLLGIVFSFLSALFLKARHKFYQIFYSICFGVSSLIVLVLSIAKIFK